MRKSRGFTLIELLAVLMIAGIMVAGGYPKLTNFLWQAKLEQEARMIYQDLLLLMEATIAAGPSEGINCLGVVAFENKTYAGFGKRIHGYSLLDPLRQLTAISKEGRNIASSGFCILPFNDSNQSLTDDEVDNLKILVTDDGKIASPSSRVNLQVKAFDTDSGETDDTDVWNILIDPDENRIRLQHLSGYQ